MIVPPVPGIGPDGGVIAVAAFEQNLREEHLRALLKRLPDFDDIEAEEKLIISRETDLSGEHYELFSLADDTLRNSFPVAATIARRTMINLRQIGVEQHDTGMQHVN